MTIWLILSLCNILGIHKLKMYQQKEVSTFEMYLHIIITKARIDDLPSEVAYIYLKTQCKYITFCTHIFILNICYNEYPFQLKIPITVVPNLLFNYEYNFTMILSAKNYLV